MKKKIHKQEQSKWWEAVSLQKYLEVGRVPRGLRIFTTPTYENPNPAMLQKWSENSSKCTTGMLEILVEFAWVDRKTLLSEIDTLTEEIKSMDSSNNFEEFYSKMEKRLEKIEEEIKTKKQRKFLRDLNDYQTGRILTFAKKYDHLYEETGKSHTGTTGDQDKDKEKNKDSIILDSGSESDISIETPSTSNMSNSIRTINFLEDYRVLNRGRTEGRGEGSFHRGRGRGGRRGNYRYRETSRGRDQTPVGHRTRGQEKKK